MQAKPSIRFVDPMFVCSNSIPYHFDILIFEPCDYGKSAACPVLAKRAVTNVRSNRIALHAIPDRLAKTTSLMDFGHCIHSKRLGGGTGWQDHDAPAPWRLI
jgi:hypothetical protein